MANEEHLARLKRLGVRAWNRWRRKCPAIQPDLSEANLAEVNLYSADLTRANLAKADLTRALLRLVFLNDAILTGAVLLEANLSGAFLNGADFSHAILARTDLFMADLTNAILAEAILDAANLFGTDLTGADFSHAQISATTFGNVDLRWVRGLETVRHGGPSTIGIDTLYRSHGEIPEVFLRGAGVPEETITHAKSLIRRPFEFYSCFISYSSKDQEFVERLYTDLRNNGVRCWFAPHDVQAGRKLHEQIARAIRAHERVLLILSAHSMQSEWVKTEITKARQREVQENRQVLFPVRLVS
jgi:TIR domain/Pentapeptide repeats (8 copies)